MRVRILPRPDRTRAHVDAYEGRLRQLIVDLHSDCGDPLLPFVIGNLAEFHGVHADHSRRITLINRTRGILHRVATDTPRAAFVPSTGLQSADTNHVHFKRDSSIEFGKRYARSARPIKGKLQISEVVRAVHVWHRKILQGDGL